MGFSEASLSECVESAEVRDGRLRVFDFGKRKKKCK